MHATGGKAAPQAALHLCGISHRVYSERRQPGPYLDTRESAVRAFTCVWGVGGEIRAGQQTSLCYD
jgi:hypothetical protein